MLSVQAPGPSHTDQTITFTLNASLNVSFRQVLAHILYNYFYFVSALNITIQHTKQL